MGKYAEGPDRVVELGAGLKHLLRPAEFKGGKTAHRSQCHSYAAYVERRLGQPIRTRLFVIRRYMITVSPVIVIKKEGQLANMAKPGSFLGSEKVTESIQLY